MDFTRHNEEVRQVWEAYAAGKPTRVPVVITSGPRIWLLDPALNPEGITWKEYLNNPETFYQVILKHKYYAAHHIPQDDEMGIPEECWRVLLEFGNVYEESWLGCEIIYPEGQIATTRPRYAGEAKYEILEMGIPNPFAGFMGHIREFYEYCTEKARHEDFHSKPVQCSHPVPLGSDGPLTVANGIRGTAIFEDMLNDEDYYHQLMDLVTTAIIQRIHAWRGHFGLDPKPARGWFADDAVQFLSTRLYREKVLPYHRRYYEALFGPGPHSIHLCGNVQRHLPTFIQELNVKSFDTGFPIQWSSLRDEIGEDVEIQGGVPVGNLLSDTPKQVAQRTREILESGIMRGGKFILKEANDLAPRVPLANLRAMYETGREYGKYT
jgi:hypothetical protein